MSVSLHTKCRFCDTKLPSAFLDLGPQPPANNLCVTDKHTDEDELYPLRVTRCSECGLAQLTHIVEPKVMFSHYLYTPSESGQSFKHFDTLAESLSKEGFSTVLDIGGNNGFILKRFKERGWTPISIEPARNLADQTNKDGIFTVNDFWGHKVTSIVLDRFPNQVDLVTAINVFAHVIDNHDFVKNVKRVLKPNGLFVIEVPSFLTMLKNGTFDLTYSEHQSYMRATDIVNFLENNEMEVFKIQEVDSHGGSLRVFAQHKNGSREEDSMVRNFLLEEYQEITPDLVGDFVKRARHFKTTFTNTVKECASKGLVVGYGAPAKATVLITYCGLTKGDIKYIVDDNPLKHNKFIPSSHIPVVSPSKLTTLPPDFVIVFPWNVKADILTKIPEGVKKIIPMPVVKVV